MPFRNCALTVFSALLLVPLSASAQETFTTRTHDFGISAGYMFEGSAYFAEFDEYSALEAGFMARVFYDRFIMEKLSFGLYGHAVLTDFYRYSEESGSTLLEAGFTMKPRFFIGEKMALKPGLNVGYRYFLTQDDYLESDGLGLNFSLELQYDRGASILPFAEVGFLAQPWGGNDDTDITFDPVLYVQIGIAM